MLTSITSAASPEVTTYILNYMASKYYMELFGNVVILVKNSIFYTKLALLGYINVTSLEA